MLLKYKPRKQNLKRVANNEVKKLGKIYLLEKGNVKTVSAHFAEKNAEYFRVISLVYNYQCLHLNAHKIQTYRLMVQAET